MAQKNFKKTNTKNHQESLIKNLQSLHGKGIITDIIIVTDHKKGKTQIEISVPSLESGYVCELKDEINSDAMAQAIGREIAEEIAKKAEIAILSNDVNINPLELMEESMSICQWLQDNWPQSFPGNVPSMPKNENL